MNYSTIKTGIRDNICTIQLFRPEYKNTINSELVQECMDAISRYETDASIFIFEGLPEVFCFGADLQSECSEEENTESSRQPGLLYDLWYKMATGPFISVSHVKGQANAGGIGFVSASDIVIADETAFFSLSELLFGLYPAMVLPFLVRKIGFQKSNYMTLMTKPVSVQTAYEWGLVDAYHKKSDVLLKQHLARLSKIPKTGIINYKKYINRFSNILEEAKPIAVKANMDIFSDKDNMNRLKQFVENGKYPWE